MAIATLPDEEYEYVPDESDDTGSDGKPLDPSVAPDDDPNVSVPDELEVAGEQLEDAADLDSDQFDPVGSGSDLPDDPTPIYQRSGEFIALDVPIAEQAAFDDAGDLYSAATGSPDDTAWDSAPDAGPAVAASASVPVLPDFDIEVHGEPEETEADPQPVQYEIQGKSDVAAWHTLALVSAQSMDAEVAGLPTSENWIFRIRAIYDDGFVGPWSAETMIDLPNDLLAPPVPSMPTLVAERGVVTVHWDGSTLSGAPQPPDYKHTAVWVSTSGEVGTWTIAGLLFADGGYLPYTFADYNVPYYFSLSSRDIVGNESARGPAATVTLKPMVEELEFQEIIQDWDERYGGVITEAEQLSEKLNGAITDIEASEAEIANLRDVELPALDKRLGDADALIREEQTQLNTKLSEAKTELAGHTTRLGEAEASLGTLKTTTLPSLQADLEATESSLSTLDTRLGAAEGEIASTGAALGARLDQAFIDVGAADSKAQSAINAASSAQADADAAQMFAETQVALLISQGQNLVRNGDFEAGTDGWNTNSFSTIATGVSRSGSKSLKIGPNPGGNIWPTSEYVPSSSGRTYYAEYWVKRTGAESTNIGVGFVIQSKTAAGGTSTPIVGRVDSESISTTEFTKVSVTYASSAADVTHVRFAPWITAGNNEYHVDDFLAVDVTEAQAAVEAAVAALARADSAHSAAGAAQSTADSAYTMAGSKSVVMYSTQEPSGTASPGDTWRQVATNGDVIAEWRWTNGGKWLSQKLTSDAISNLDVGKLTVGTAAISTAVIDKLWADVISAKKIYAEQLVVGEGENLVSWPASSSSTYSEIPHIQYYGGPNSGASPGWQKAGGVADGNHVFIQNDTITPGSDTIVLSIGTKPRTGVNGESGWAVEPGEWFQFSAHVKLGGSYTNGVPFARFGLYWYKPDGTYISGNLGPATMVNWSWQKLTVDGRAPDTAARLVVYLRYDKPGGVRVDLPALYRKKDGGLIVAGSITGDHVEANSVAAKVATVIELNADRIKAGTVSTARLNTDAIAAATAAVQKADIKNLTVSNGTFSSAVIDKLWADVITARKLYATQVVIGAGGNLIADPHFNDSTLNAARQAHANSTGSTGWYYTGSYWYSKSGLADGTHTFQVVNSPGEGSYGAIDIEPGARYRFQWEGFISGASALARAAMRVKKLDGTTRYIGTSGSTSMTSGWATYTQEWQPESDDASFTFEAQFLSVTNTTRLAFRNPSVVTMTDGSLIVAGSVDAAAINSKSVSAEVAKFIDLDVSRLVSSSAKISEAVITKLWTDVVHSRKITTEMLAVGSFDNIIPDPTFAEGPTTWGAKTSMVTYGTDGELGYMQIIGDSAQRGYYSPYVEVMGGEEYHYTVRISRTTAGNLPASSIGMYVWSIDQNGTRVGITDVSEASFLDSISLGAGDWRTFRGTIKLPATAVKARFGLYSQSTQSATIRFTQPKATRVAGATLIGDGAIVTDKLAANAITAPKIATNAITADKVHATAIDGMVITGATMRTNSAGTGIIINNSGIEGKTSAGRKFFLSALTGELEAVGSITTGMDNTFRAKLSNRDGIAALDIYSAGGDAAHHAALIAWDEQVALRRYTSRTAFDSELAMTSGFTRLQNQGGGSTLTLGSGTANLTNGTDSEFGITYSGTRMRYGTGSELYLTGSTVKLSTTNGGDILRSILYNGAYHTVMGQVEATTTTGGANINCNAGYIRKVTSASKYKLFPQAFDETLDDKILSIDAKHWIDKREAEETAELMCPETLDEATDPAIDPNQHAANPMRRVPGVIAEEVRDAGLDEFVVYDAAGEVEGVMYDRLGVALIPVVKRQRDRLAEQADRITQLESQMAQLLARVEALEAA